jgi:hypothetical protein
MKISDVLDGHKFRLMVKHFLKFPNIVHNNLIHNVDIGLHDLWMVKTLCDCVIPVYTDKLYYQMHFYFNLDLNQLLHYWFATL